jgi:hypothetical protein
MCAEAAGLTSEAAVLPGRDDAIDEGFARQLHSDTRLREIHLQALPHSTAHHSVASIHKRQYAGVLHRMIVAMRVIVRAVSMLVLVMMVMGNLSTLAKFLFRTALRGVACDNKAGGAACMCGNGDAVVGGNGDVHD